MKLTLFSIFPRSLQLAADNDDDRGPFNDVDDTPIPTRCSPQLELMLVDDL
jgi:hypothetical protein